MDIQLLLQALGYVLLSALIIKYACDSFEDASDHLGRKVYKMPSGVRGATIEAIASSLPELFTTTFLLFVYNDADGFSAGIATCAGSAVFNAVIIPAVCIIAICTKGVLRDGVLEKVKHISLNRRVTLRDGFFFLAAELMLIYFLANHTLEWWMGASLMALYGIYFGYLMLEMVKNRTPDETDAEAADETETNGRESSVLIKLLTFDFNGLLFGGRDFTPASAWTVLGLATATIAAASYLLSEAVMMSSQALQIPAYFTAVILAAAATSVPDTVISVKDALKGDYDDAVSNAVGSNIFDICIALGLPLTLYGLIHGSVTLGTGSGASANVQELRIALILVTTLVLLLFLVGKTRDSAVQIGLRKGVALLLVYLIWTGFIIARAVDAAWLNTFVSAY